MEAGDLLQRAQRADAGGDSAAASRLFSALLEIDPAQPAAVHYAANQAISVGDVERALSVFRRALDFGANDVVRFSYALLLLRSRRPADAIVPLQTILQTDPNAFEVELMLGRACEALGDRERAVHSYFGAVRRARAAGAWLTDASVPEWLHDDVVNAMRLAEQGYCETLFRALDPIRERHGSGSLERVEDAVRVHLKMVPAEYTDPRQRPTFFYFPGLHTVPVFPNDRFPWIAELQTHFPAIKAEALRLMRDAAINEPFNRYRSAEQAAASLRGTRGTPAWNAKFFFRHGAAYIDTHTLCPATSAALECVDLCQIPEHAPEVCFSLLTPGTHILPHRGVSNVRLVCHLALVIPQGDCALHVAGRHLRWQEGGVFAFDDTFEHEAWNRSAETRLVLLMDVWNPELSQAEREGVSAVITAIGEFNKACNLR